MEQNADMEPDRQVNQRPPRFRARGAGVRGRGRVRRSAFSRGQRRPIIRVDDLQLADPLYVMQALQRDHTLEMPRGQVDFSWIEAEERRVGPTDEWYFEAVKTYKAKPGDDLQTIIKNYAKISLECGAVYEINSKIRVTGACYIIGNCAVLRPNLPAGEAMFEVLNVDFIPSIGFMERIVFSNVIFDCRTTATVVCCISERNTLFHNCVFSGPHMLCLDLRAGAEVRGCHFVGAVCALRSKGLYSIRVKNSIFEKCAFGVVTGSKASISHCMFKDCTCSIMLGGQGTIAHSQFIVTTSAEAPMNLQLCTCEGNGSHVVPLGNIHFASHREASWPTFYANTLVRVRLYMGRRRGVFHPKQSTLSMCVIAAPRGVVQRIYLFGVYDATCAIMQLGEAGNAASERLCTCGFRHSTPSLRATYVTDTRIDRELNSQDTAEFFSSDEDNF
ncbi:E1B 55K [Canine mastadenovirus A]|nr:E1B 55K [Canine mastadenovirus A]